MASNGYVSSSYELKGHRQTKATACPGDHFYETIKTYPHWVRNSILYEDNITAYVKYKFFPD